MDIHRIKDQVYGSHLSVLIGGKKEVSTFVNTRFKCAVDFSGAEAVFFVVPSGEYFIWLPRYSNSINTQSLIVHEIFHFTLRRLADCGLKLVDESEEAYSQFIMHIYKQIVTKLSKYYAKTE